MRRPAREQPTSRLRAVLCSGSSSNSITERYWIPEEEGPNYRITPCLQPLASHRADVHVLSGLDNASAGGQGNGHTNSMSGLMTGTPYTGRGASGPSLDQLIAAKIGGESRSVPCKSALHRNRTERACSAT